MGFSQGGIISRFIVQECLSGDIGPKTRNLITVGTPHMGVETFAGCEIVELEMLFNFFDPQAMMNSATCYILNYLTHLTYFLPFMQNTLTTNNYVRQGEKLDEYYEYQMFLPFLNNEVFHPDFARYRNNIMKLNSFTMVQWDDDSVLFPRETAHFGQLSNADG